MDEPKKTVKGYLDQVFSITQGRVYKTKTLKKMLDRELDNIDVNFEIVRRFARDYSNVNIAPLKLVFDDLWKGCDLTTAVRLITFFNDSLDLAVETLYGLQKTYQGVIAEIQERNQRVVNSLEEKISDLEEKIKALELAHGETKEVVIKYVTAVKRVSQYILGDPEFVSKEQNELDLLSTRAGSALINEAAAELSMRLALPNFSNSIVQRPDYELEAMNSMLKKLSKQIDPDDFRTYLTYDTGILNKCLSVAESLMPALQDCIKTLDDKPDEE